jgi:signal transduction histidine kinase
MRREIQLMLGVLILAAVPTAVLSLLAARTLRNWDIVLERQLATAAERALRGVASELQVELKNATEQVARDVAEAVSGPNAAAALVDLAGSYSRSNSLIGQLIVYQADTGLRYPPAAAPAWRGAPAAGQAAPGGPALREAAALLEQAQKAQYQDRAPEAAQRHYAALLKRSELPAGLRAAALLGLAQSRRLAGDAEGAAAAWRALGDAAAGADDLRDEEGYLYELVARRELLELQIQAGLNREAWETALDLLAALSARYDALMPAQRRSLRRYLDDAFPLLQQRLRSAPGAAAALARRPRAEGRWQEAEKTHLLGARERETFAQAVFQCVASGRPVDGADWVLTNGAWFVFHRLPAPAGWYAGFRAEPRALAARLKDLLRTGAGKELRLAADARAPEWAELLPEPQRTAGGGNPERRLAELPLAPPLAGIALSAWPVDPAALHAGARLQARLYVWGVSLLALAVILSVGIALRLTAGEMRRARARSDFVAGVSHDLRTPLAAMRMLAESLYLDNIHDAETRKKFLETIVKESDRLSQLTERALYFIRLGQNSLRFKFTEGDLRELVVSTVAAFGARFAPGALELSVDAARDLPPVSFDADTLTQVLFNLLENAVKYSPQRKDIHVAVRRGPGRRETQIEVRDRGIGIAPRDRRRIFRRFNRLHDPRAAGVAGLGMGLALCRHVVRAHGGRIEVEGPPDGGSLFRVILPGAP